MTRLETVSIVASLAFPLALLHAQNPPMKVFIGGATVTSVKEVDDATKKDLKARQDQTKNARKALEKQIKDQYGKKRESWPPDREDELYVLEEAEAVARANYEYRKLDQKNINDSVKDLLEELKDKSDDKTPRVQLVASAADADIVVEVLARRGEKSLPTQFKPDWCYVLFSIAGGPKLDPARFAAVPKEYRIRKGFDWGIYKISGPTPELPLFRFEANNLRTNASWGSFGCYSSAADAAVAGIDKFIEDNYAVLTGSAARK